jgi:cellulose biosynthesis protein BcsQ
VIPVDTKIRNASLKGVPAPIIEPNSKAVLAYTELLELLLQEKSHS